MDTYYTFSRGLIKIVQNFVMTDPESETVRQSEYTVTDVHQDPSNSQIFNFMVRPTEIHWCERTKDFATVYFKMTAYHMPENYTEEGRKTFALSFLKATVIDPIMWSLPIEDGRGFVTELLEDVRVRWNMQMETGKRMFQNTDALNGRPHLEQSKLKDGFQWGK
jgi:hypothetical protein